MKAWQRLKQFHGDSSFSTWITRIAINLCLDHLRRRKRQPTDSLDAMNEDGGGVERYMPAVTVNPTERLERQELRARIETTTHGKVVAGKMLEEFSEVPAAAAGDGGRRQGQDIAEVPQAAARELVESRVEAAEQGRGQRRKTVFEAAIRRFGLFTDL